MSNLSDVEIANIIRKYSPPPNKDALLGVFPIDSLPHRLSHYPACMVINTQSHNLPGEHWISIFITKDKRGEVFDSLGLPLSNYLIRWLNQFTKSWQYNRKIYQHISSDKCGAYAIYFILNRLDNKTPTFTDSPAVNDELVNMFYATLKD